MIGHVVGSYKVTEKIGEGGMGAVFKGIDLMLEREVAIKMLRPELASQPQVVERFRSEAVTLAKLNHPNIATLFSFLRQGEDFFMVMEFVRGQTLENLIRRSGAMTCDRAIALFCQALEGIDHAHRMGIVHRDIKPANMMLTENGTLKVMDFGIARVLGTSRMTKQGNIVGTIEYMSPEQVRGQETDARSDIYSLGILLYEMVTGHVPFYSDSEFDLMRMQIEDAPRPPRMLSANIPHTVEKAIMRALAKKIEARFQSAADFRAALIGDASTPLPAPNPAVMRSADGTQLMGSLGAGPTVPKETRLPEQVAGNPHAGQLKSTRLASDQAPALSYASQSAGPAFQSAQAATGSPPLPPASRSNAKLFIGLAAVLFVIIAGTAVVLLTIAKPQRSQQAVPSSQPVQSTTPSPAPAAGADQPSLTPPPQQPQPMPSQPPQVELGKPAVDSSPRNAVASADTAVQSKSSKAVRKESSAEAAARKEKERKAAEARRLLSQ
jgi:serine/threonine-protein kinase